MGRRTIDIDIVLPRRWTGDVFEEGKHARNHGQFASSGGGEHSDHGHMKKIVHEAADELGQDAGHSPEKIAENNSKAHAIASSIAGKKISAAKLEDAHNISSGLAKRIADKHKAYYQNTGATKSAGGQSGQAARVASYLKQKHIGPRR